MKKTASKSHHVYSNLNFNTSFLRFYDIEKLEINILR